MIRNKFKVRRSNESCTITLNDQELKGVKSYNVEAVAGEVKLVTVQLFADEVDVEDTESREDGR